MKKFRKLTNAEVALMSTYFFALGLLVDWGFKTRWFKAVGLLLAFFVGVALKFSDFLLVED